MTNPIQTWRQQKTTRNYLNKKGKVLTWTKIFVTTHEFKKYAPYPVVLVELENGDKVYGQLVDYKESDLKIGAKVESVLRVLHSGSPEDIVEYGLKFKPL